MADPKTKTINGVNFQISQPYEPGMTINEAEARVLNQTRSENIGNNVRAKLKELLDAGDTAGGEQLVAQKDAEYVFTLANVGEGRKLDTYEREAEKIARELLRNHLAQSGRKLGTPPEGVTEDEWKERIQSETDRIATTDQVIKAARQRVDARKKQADSLMEALEGAAL